MFDCRAESHDPIRRPERQRTEEDPFHHAEHGCARGDAHRNRQHHRGRDDGCAPGHAPGVPEVVAKCLHRSVPSSRGVPHGAIDCRRKLAADERAYGQAGLLPVPATGYGNAGGRGQLVEFLVHVAGEKSLVPVSGQQAHQQCRKPGWRWLLATHQRCPPPKSGERSCIIRASMAVECRSARAPVAVRA